MRKAQLSLEMLYIVGVELLIIITIVIIAQNNNSEIKEKEKMLEMRRTCMNLRNTISAVYSNGDGSYFITPVDHDIIIEKNILFLKYKDGEIECNIPFKALEKDYFTINKGLLSIQNNNNTISIKNV